MFESQQYLSGLSDAVAFFSKKFESLTSETLCVAHLTTDLRCLKVVDYPGNDDFLIIPNLEIISDVLKIGSAGIILAHNHLSGDSTPSAADIKATSRLRLIEQDTNFTVLDHLVFAGNKWSSMRQLGLM